MHGGYAATDTSFGVVTIRVTEGATGSTVIWIERAAPVDPLLEELRQMAAESEVYWTKRDAERLEGHRLAARAVRPRPSLPRDAIRPRRHESARRWTQAVRAFRGRVS